MLEFDSGWDRLSSGGAHSLRLVLPALAGCLRLSGDLVPMVKPQFEVGRERVGSGGVVRDPEWRAQAVLAVAEAAGDGALPLVLGGDHSVALGSLGGMARAHGPGGVLWLDAHGDLIPPLTGEAILQR